MDGRSDLMSTAATAFDQRQGVRVRRSGTLADRIIRNTARFMRALAGELGRIPQYQEEAERRREVLRRR
jgi:hypothetical protein